MISQTGARLRSGSSGSRAFELGDRLFSDPPARYIQGCSLEWLDPGLALVSKDAEFDPSARFETIGSQRGGGQLNKPVMAHPDSRMIRLLDQQVVTLLLAQTDYVLLCYNLQRA